MNTFDDLIFIEDELGVILNGLTASELKIIARTCGELAVMPYKEREELFLKVKVDDILFEEREEGFLFEE